MCVCGGGGGGRPGSLMFCLHPDDSSTTDLTIDPFTKVCVLTIDLCGWVVSKVGELEIRSNKLELIARRHMHKASMLSYSGMMFRSFSPSQQTNQWY